MGSQASENDFDHRVRAQRAVQLVELLATGRGDGDGDPQVLTALTFTQLNGACIEGGVKRMGNHADSVHQTIHLDTHHLDGKLGRVLNKRLSGRYFRRLGCGHVLDSIKMKTTEKNLLFKANKQAVVSGRMSELSAFLFTSAGFYV